ncbi:uncharacterized protein LOC141899560 [Tubulanus polymorphus]|uniref:uncharacterized protein LOC141899560 n=1 Tax=Tubulanus polymorphus TaxID=672921 RepID=UPI003DA6358B
MSSGTSSQGVNRSHVKTKKKKKATKEASPASAVITDQSLDMSHLVTALQTAKIQERRLKIVNSRLADELDEKEQTLIDNEQQIHTYRYHVQYLQELLRENNLPFTVEVNRTLMPGVSEEIAHQLRTENATLKYELNYSKCDYYDMQEIVEANRSLYKELEAKNNSITELEDKIKHLETVQTAGSCKEVYALQEELKKHIEKETLQEIICNSLYYETEGFKQSLLKAEEEIQKYMMGTEIDGKINGDKVIATSPEEKKETLALRAKFKEVVELNKKWQTYNNEQQAVMKTLKSRVEDLEKIIKTTATKGEAERGKEVIEKFIKVHTNELDRIQHEKAQAENELKKSKLDLMEAKKCIETEKLLKEALEKELHNLKAAKVDVLSENTAQTEMTNLRSKYKEVVEVNKKWQIYGNANDSKMNAMQKRILELEKQLEERDVNSDLPEKSDVEHAGSLSEINVIKSKLKESMAQNVKWQVYNNDLQTKMKDSATRMKELEAIIESTVQTGQDAEATRQLLELNKNELLRVQEENNAFSTRMNAYNEVLEKLRMTERQLSESERAKEQFHTYGIELKQEKCKNAEFIKKLDRMRSDIKQLQADKRTLKKQNQELQIKLSQLGPAQAEASIHPELKSQYESHINHLQSELYSAEQRMKSMENSQTFVKPSVGGGLEKLKREWSTYTQYRQRSISSASSLSSLQQVPVYVRSASQTPVSPDSQLKSPNSPPFDPPTGVCVTPMEKCPYCRQNFKITEMDEHNKGCHEKMKK